MELKIVVYFMWNLKHMPILRINFRTTHLTARQNEFLENTKEFPLKFTRTSIFVVLSALLSQTVANSKQ